MRRTLCGLAAVLSCLLAGQAAWGDAAFSCGNHIVSIGMSMPEVRQHCGEPSSIEIVEQAVRSGPRVVGKTELHIWTYESSTKLRRVLKFSADKLVSIQ